MKESTTTETKNQNKELVTEQKEKQCKQIPTTHKTWEMERKQLTIETI